VKTQATCVLYVTTQSHIINNHTNEHLHTALDLVKSVTVVDGTS